MSKLIVLIFSIVLLSACSLNINLNEPSPTPVTQELPTDITQTSQPENTPTSNLPTIEEQLTLFFATKFSRPQEEAILTVSQNTGAHATGGIKFQDDISGGMWLAHNDNGNWIVDYDGNGTIACEKVEPFNYPSSIITECWDENTNNIKYL